MLLLDPQPSCKNMLGSQRLLHTACVHLLKAIILLTFYIHVITVLIVVTKLANTEILLYIYILFPPCFFI